jgi:hypothetical protein
MRSTRPDCQPQNLFAGRSRQTTLKDCYSIVTFRTQRRGVLRREVFVQKELH